MSSEPEQVEVGSAAGEQGTHAHTCRRGLCQQGVAGTLGTVYYAGAPQLVPMAVLAPISERHVVLICQLGDAIDPTHANSSGDIRFQSFNDLTAAWNMTERAATPEEGGENWGKLRRNALKGKEPVVSLQNMAVFAAMLRTFQALD